MTCEKKKNCLVVGLDGEIDHHFVEEVKSEIDITFESSKTQNIIFDFSDVTFMDSAGVGLIIGRYKNAKRVNGQAAVVNVSETVGRILKISGIFKIINKYESVSAAVKSFE